jgi:hypothetical protein
MDQAVVSSLAMSVTPSVGVFRAGKWGELAVRFYLWKIKNPVKAGAKNHANRFHPSFHRRFVRDDLQDPMYSNA